MEGCNDDELFRPLPSGQPNRVASSRDRFWKPSLPKTPRTSACSTLVPPASGMGMKARGN